MIIAYKISRYIGLAVDSKYNTDTLLNYKVDVKMFEEVVKVKLAN